MTWTLKYWFQRDVPVGPGRCTWPGGWKRGLGTSRKECVPKASDWGRGESDRAESEEVRVTEHVEVSDGGESDGGESDRAG